MRRLHRRKPEERKGAATVEMALCLPVLVMVTLGTISVCQMIYLKQESVIVATECTRYLARPGITQQNALDRGAQMLSDRGISGATVRASSDNTNEGYSRVWVEVRIPINKANLTLSWMTGGRVTSRKQMYREYRNSKR